MPNASMKEKMSGVDMPKKRKGLMITPELCIACRACQTACKQWNKLPGDRSINRGTYENPPRLTPNLYNQIRFIEKTQGDEMRWLFVRSACMHCGEAGCMDICPAPGAISRTREGAVVFNKDRCIGCKLCAVGCPFDVPAFDENDKISKCTLCWDRISNGLTTSCSKVCPTEAIQYGTRDDLIAGARAGGFSVYGEKDLKGLGVMFALKDDPKVYDLQTPVYDKGMVLWDSFLRPLTALGLGAVATAALLHYVTVGPKDVEPEDREGGK